MSDDYLDDYSVISWKAGEATLKSYAAAMSSSSRRRGTTVKIELEVMDAYRLGTLLQNLDGIKSKQDRVAEKKPRHRGPLLLTHGDD